LPPRVFSPKVSNVREAEDRVAQTDTIRSDPGAEAALALDSRQCTRAIGNSKRYANAETIIGRSEKVNRKTQIVEGRCLPDMNPHGFTEKFYNNQKTLTIHI
jgi:hypothetical protein